MPSPSCRSMSRPLEASQSSNEMGLVGFTINVVCFIFYVFVINDRSSFFVAGFFLCCLMMFNKRCVFCFAFFILSCFGRFKVFFLF